MVAAVPWLSLLSMCINTQRSLPGQPVQPDVSACSAVQQNYTNAVARVNTFSAYMIVSTRIRLLFTYPLLITILVPMGDLSKLRWRLSSRFKWPSKPSRVWKCRLSAGQCCNLLREVTRIVMIPSSISYFYFSRSMSTPLMTLKQRLNFRDKLAWGCLSEITATIIRAVQVDGILYRFG